MAVLPYLVRNLLEDEFYQPTRLYDQNFGLSILDDDLLLRRPSLTGLLTPLGSGYARALRHLQPDESGVSTVTNDKNEFKVTLDVQEFKPEEVKVKIAGNYVVVSGKHEEKQDKHGYISREFTRKYRLPDNVRQEAIVSSLSSDGLLSIVAPKKVEAIEGREREIKVTQTNKPAVKEKVGSKAVSGDDKMET